MFEPEPRKATQCDRGPNQVHKILRGLRNLKTTGFMELLSHLPCIGAGLESLGLRRGENGVPLDFLDLTCHSLPLESVFGEKSTSLTCSRVVAVGVFGFIYGTRRWLVCPPQKTEIFD